MYQFAISSKMRLQWLLLSAAIHTLIYVSALTSGFGDGLIIPGFWVRIPEGPPASTSGFSDFQSIGETAFVFVFPSRILVFLLSIHNYPQLQNAKKLHC